MKNLPFLREFTGVLVHDRKALYHFGTGHTECNVHLLRYLKKNTEDTNHSWSGEMVSLLCSRTGNGTIRLLRDWKHFRLKREPDSRRGIRS